MTAATSARISNQQVFLSSLARTLQSNGTLSDPVKLYSIAKAALANMQLSDSLMDPTRMISIAKALKDTDLNKIAFIQYPTAYAEGGGAVAPTDSAEYVRTALQNDLPVYLRPGRQADSEFGTVADPERGAARGGAGRGGPGRGGAAPRLRAPTVEALPRRRHRPDRRRDSLLGGPHPRRPVGSGAESSSAASAGYDGCRVCASIREETSHSPVECTTLLRWSPRKGTRGSNPLVSARESLSSRTCRLRAQRPVGDVRDE